MDVDLPDLASEDMFSTVAKRAEDDLEACESLLRRYRNDAREVLRGLAGPLLDGMLQQPLRTIQELDSSIPEMRVAALLLGGYYWEPDRGCVGPCFKLLLVDASSVVRGVALVVAARLYAFVNDPKRHLRKLLARLRLLKDEYALLSGSALANHAEVENRLQHVKQRQIERLAGPLLDAMLSSCPTTDVYLGHPNPKVRMAALILIKDYWKNSVAYADRYEQVMCQDVDWEVRSFALMFLSKVFENTSDPRIGRIFAEFVRNESVPLEFRQFAYKGLFVIRGMPILAWPRTRIVDGVSSLAMRFPEDIDWLFVDSFRNALP